MIENNEFYSILFDLGFGIIYLIACFILFFIGKQFFQLLNRRIQVNEELVKKDNVAFAVSMVGYYLGLVMTIGGALVGPSHGLGFNISVWLWPAGYCADESCDFD